MNLKYLQLYHISKIFRILFLVFVTVFSVTSHTFLRGIINYIIGYVLYIAWYIVEWKDLRVTRKELKD